MLAQDDFEDSCVGQEPEVGLVVCLNIVSLYKSNISSSLLVPFDRWNIIVHTRAAYERVLVRGSTEIAVVFTPII